MISILLNESIEFSGANQFQENINQIYIYIHIY